MDQNKARVQRETKLQEISVQYQSDKDRVVNEYLSAQENIWRQYFKNVGGKPEKKVEPEETK